MTIRALIVDDERLARQKIRRMLAAESDVTVLRECANGAEAIDAIRDDTPDLVFLDVQMPGMDGFAVLRALGTQLAPAIVFVTAHEQYAVRAFEVHALDYLLKPFDAERFRVAIGRVRHQLASGDHHACATRIASMIRELKPPEYLERIPVRTNGRVFFIKAEEIDWIESADNYARVHHKRGAHLVRETMTALEASLDPRRFVRVHRTAIVNADRIEEIRTLFHGDHVVVLQGGREIPCGRTYRDRLETI
ncbi:MAG TPA: LytTR family DNA-binding domain-containing protein, partial [Thermoanaerobaculia bacterium]|nr:LytTR family DNA-binding domain-containing protein [Thermoanaerobaculia bacterium]